MYDKILTDKDLLPFFSLVDKEQMKEKQKTFFVYICGGSAAWNGGKAMVATQRTPGFRPEHFDQVMQHIVGTLREHGISPSIISDLNDTLYRFIDECTEGFREAKKSTIFMRLGGSAAINQLVNGMYHKIWKDPQLKDHFMKTDKDTQKERMKRYLTYLTGGS